MADYVGFQQQGTNLTKAEIRKKQLEIIKAYSDTLKKVRRDIKTLYATQLAGIKPEDYYNHMIKFDRLKKIESQILIDLRALNGQVNTLTAQSSSLALSNNYYRQQYATNWLSSYSFTTVKTPMIDYAVYQRAKDWKRLAEKVQNLLKVSNGVSLTTILRDNNIKALSKISQTLNQGLIQGSTFTQMSRSLKSTFDFNLSNSLRVVRTESHRTLNQGQLLQWNDAKDKGVEGTRQVLSVLDTRTRNQSAQVDGRKENEYGLFDYPNGRTGENGVASPGNSGNPAWDVNDREEVIHIIDGESPQVRRGRNPVTGKNEVFTFRDFNTWAADNNLKYNKSGKLVISP
jgi:hypothetical protein